MSLYGGMNTVQGSNSCLCDLRSDTMTAPNDAMRAAMASAVVGDDVYGEDPTVTALESRLATLLGKEAAVFTPTGTQSNLAGLMAHCGRGDQIIVGDEYHIYCDEAAGASVLGGISVGEPNCD
jgi:threonine aldolase